MGNGTTSLGPRRERAIAELLNAQLIEAKLLPSGIEARPLPSDTLLVLVRRSIASLPACPDWTQMPGDNFENQPMSNWSCATAVNFGMMLADPADLVRGRDPGFADGEYLARSVEKYRAGKTKPIIRDSASSEIFPSSGDSGNGK
jgi:pilus assembly protein CpaD